MNINHLRKKRHKKLQSVCIRCVCNERVRFVILDKPEDMESEIGSLLDSIYGKKWREKQDQILPKSEPQKKESKYVSVTYSERYQYLTFCYTFLFTLSFCCDMQFVNNNIVPNFPYFLIFCGFVLIRL